MQGFLDHLEVSGHVVHKKTWTRRFFRLNDAFHCLEFFTDASMESRKGRIELKHAHVASADELGELLFSSSHQSSPTKLNSKISIENSRRFVFRVAATAGGSSSSTENNEIHYLCAEIPASDADSPSSVDSVASRQCMDQWLRALRATALRASTPAVSAVTAVDLRELNVKIAQYMGELHISAHVTARREDVSAKGVYELTVQAWTLQRELLPVDDDDAESADEWQILEYSCAWQVAKSSAQLRDFDAQLRHFFGDQLRDLVLPSFSGVRAFLKHKDDDESERRIGLYNSYWDSLLRLPALSVFGSDCGAMLDTFLEISTHLTAFKKLEKESGQNLKLRNKRVVPWPERERFEQLYAIHMEMVRAQGEKRQHQARHSRRVSAKTKAEREQQRQESQRHHHHHSHSHHHSQRRSEKTVVVVEEVVEEEEPPRPVEPTGETVESVHERMARIGHKLLVEAFQTPGATHVRKAPPTPSPTEITL